MCNIDRGNLLYIQEMQTWCSVTMLKGGMGWEVGGRFKREETYVYLWLIHADSWQKPVFKALTFN